MRAGRFAGFTHTRSLPIIALMALGFVLFSTGCATQNPWLEFRPNEQSTARILWQQSAEKRLIADAVFLQDAPAGAPSTAAPSDAATVLLVGKEHPLLKLHLQGQRLHAAGRMVPLGWRGAVDRAPGDLADWAVLLQAWATARRLPGEGHQELHTDAYRLAWEKRDGDLRGFQVQPNGRLTRFTVQIAPGQ